MTILGFVVLAAASILYFGGKRILCLFVFRGQHCFTPWAMWHKRGGVHIRFRWCEYCGKMEVTK